MTLIAAGTGAGLAAAFNAPLAGLVLSWKRRSVTFAQSSLGQPFSPPPSPISSRD
jgi:hypothetical protein